MNGQKVTSGFTPKKTLAAIAVGSVLMLSSPAVLAADKVNGSMKGQVQVEAGNSLANVQVSLVHTSKGITRKTTTDSNGNFNLKALPIGNYTVTFTKDGFDTVQESEIQIKAGNSSVFNVSMFSEGVERIQITGSNIQRIDFENSTASITLTAEELAVLPIAQDLTSVALLSPATSLAADQDGDYGRGVSFNGSSVAENGYFLNGLNITDIRKGLGYIDMPWEAIAQTSVVSGGVSAEYGQFIGGVTDLVTKSGTNEFQFGVSVDYVPGSWTSQSPDTWGYDTTANSNGDYPLDPKLLTYNQEDYFGSTKYNIYASGAILEDTLFFYGVFNPQRIEDNSSSTSQYTHNEKEADYWLAKLDWYITDSHSLGFTAMNNEWKQSQYSASYDYENRERGEFGDPIESEWGGSLWSVNYSGIITDDFSISAVYGVTEQESRAINPTAGQPPAWDYRNGYWERLTDFIGHWDPRESKDTRTQARIDFDWELGDHSLRFGYTQEVIETYDNTTYSGGGTKYEYYWAGQGDVDWFNWRRANEGLAPTALQAGDAYGKKIHYAVAGETESRTHAFYIEDTWRVTDEVTLNLGIRNSGFESDTSAGDTYAEMSNQWAPRLGAIWDVGGNGETKVYANYGRYFMPISPNTNVRMTLGELNQSEYVMFDSIDAEGRPVNEEYINLFSSGDGTFTQPYRTLRDANLESMYSDEYVLGVTQTIGDDWTVGARYIYQILETSIEDTNMQYALSKFQKENPEEAKKLIDDQGWNIAGDWVGLLTNPGSSVLVQYDVDGDGVIGESEGVTWDADYLGYPKAERKYQALELTIEGKPTDNSRIAFSYTHSKSEGNTEGLVSGTHSQADPGFSTSFDSPEQVDYSYGETSNNIPNKFKFYGSYDFTEDFNMGFVFLAQEGRTRNRLGYHPQDVDSCAPDADVTTCSMWNVQNFYSAGKPSPRGSGGQGDWLTSLDLSARYIIDVGYGNIALSAKVFNVFNSNTPATYNDMTEFGNEIGQMNPNYGNATSYQAPRSFLLTARYDF